MASSSTPDEDYSMPDILEGLNLTEAEFAALDRGETLLQCVSICCPVFGYFNLSS